MSGAGWKLVQARNGGSHSLDVLDENLVVKNNDVDDILSLLALHPPRDLSRPRHGSQTVTVLFGGGHRKLTMSLLQSHRVV